MEKVRKTQIQNWIFSQKGKLLTDLMELVSIPSVSDTAALSPPFGEDCQRALRWMLAKGQSYGLTGTNYDNHAGSLSLNGEEAENPKNVTGIWCHLDVVPAGEGWQTPPFQPVYRDGLITGRGSQDNKSAAVMGLYFLKGLKELGISLKRPAALYFGLSEECGMQDVDYFLNHFSPPGLSLIADCAFPACFGEKGILTVSFSTGPLDGLHILKLQAGTAHNIIPGFASLTLKVSGEERCLTARGLAGHTAFPAGSRNAIALLLEQLPDIPGLSPETLSKLRTFHALSTSTDGSAAGIRAKDSRYGDLTCCASLLTCEENSLKLTLDIRYPHSVSSDFLFSRLKSFAEEAGLHLEVLSFLPSFGFSQEHPVIQTLTEVYNRETLSESTAYTMAGATYAAKLPNAIPFGISFPDKSAIHRRFPKGHGDFHQPDESVELDRILQALSIYFAAFMELDKLY